MNLWSALVGIGMALTASPGEGAGAAPVPPGARLDYFVVVTGGDLLDGAYADTHTLFLARTLLPLGGHCVGSLAVDDRLEPLRDALRFASGRAPLVLVTGGLGPTQNDITREVVSAVTDIPLSESPVLVAELARRFGQSPDQLRDNVRRQARVPVRGSFLSNSNGTAAGLVFQAAPAVIIALPGPPRELQPMVTTELVPLLQQRFGLRKPGASRTLRFVGAGQSLLDQTLRDRQLLTGDLLVYSQFEGGRVDFSFALPTDREEDRARLDQLVAGAREHLGDYLYAVDGATLEDVVLRSLRNRGQRLLLLEIASGGAVSAGLRRSDLASSVFLGAYHAPSAQALARLLPESRGGGDSASGNPPDLRALAERVQPPEAPVWVVAVGELEARARAPANAEIGFLDPGHRWDGLRVALRDNAEAGRTSLATEILDRLRRRLLDKHGE